jgi:hypothetical protein
MREDWPDDMLLSIRVWDSSVQTLIALLWGLAQLSEPGRERLPAEIRSHLLQAMDSTADLDIVCNGLADALEQARREASGA